MKWFARLSPLGERLAASHMIMVLCMGMGFRILMDTSGRLCLWNAVDKRTPKMRELAFVLRKRMVVEEGNGHRNEQGNK
jgi:hypothetical protein